MNFWIIQTGEPMFTDGDSVRGMRAMNLANTILKEGHNVTIFTSNFDHFTKKKRFPADKRVDISESLTIEFVDSPGYTKNISLRRFFDHFILGQRMQKKMKVQKLPDSAFLGYPPIEVAWFSALHLKKNKVPYILDVKDAWPTNIIEFFPSPVRPLVKILLTPYFLMFTKTARYASRVTSISEDFLEWSIKTSKREVNDKDFVSYLTSPNNIAKTADIFEAEKWFGEKVILDPEVPTLYFVGSLTRSFDFALILKLAEMHKINLLIGGNGEQFDDLNTKAENMKNIHMLGWLDITQIDAVARKSDFAILPLKPLFDFQMSYPNKFFDYISRGKPVLSNLAGATKNLIEKENLGYYYSNFEDLLKLVENYEKKLLDLDTISGNCLRVYQQKFSFDKTYKNILDNLMDITR